MKVKKISKFAIAISCIGLMACTSIIPVAPGAYKPAEDEAGIKKEHIQKEAEKKAEIQDTVVVPEASYTQPDVVEVLDNDEVKPDVPKVENLPDATPEITPVLKTDLVKKPIVSPKEVTRSEHFVAVDKSEGSFLKHYNVVIGSFGVKTNADLLRTKLLDKYKPVIVKNDQDMYRVILKSFDDYTEAHQFIDTIKAQYFDAWVLVYKK